MTVAAPVLGRIADPWRVLVVDDDEQVHAVTRLALGDFQFEGRPLEILNAMSAEQARALWRSTADIALVLLDVVMETETAGLDFVRFVREEMGDLHARLVLRTGHAGQVPPLDLVARYEIDDYRTKTELTFERLNVIVGTALRNYRLLTKMALRQRQLEEALLDLERFVFLASHDLQTPLHSTLNFAQLLERRHSAELSPVARELLDYVVGGAREMEELVNGLLEYSDAGRGDDVFRSEPLDDILDVTCGRLHALIERRSVTIERGEFPPIICNPAQIALLLLNLVENAIKFQPGDHPWVRVEARDAGLSWELRVVDRGIGIDAPYLEYVFAPFRHLHTADQYPGSGIGLAICRRIAEAHGGHIRAESVKDQGTTIIVTLPKRVMGCARLSLLRNDARSGSSA